MLLFEMLTGNAPFRAKNRGVLQKKILTEKIKYPTFLTSAAHKLLTALLQRDEARHCMRRAALCAALTRAMRCSRSALVAMGPPAPRTCSSTSSSSPSIGVNSSCARCACLNLVLLLHC